MKSVLIKNLICPSCGRSVTIVSKQLVCLKKHKFQIIGGVPVMSELDPYQKIEARAWEDEWKKGVEANALLAYKKNMKIFKKLGFWEESGEAARLIPSNKSWNVLDLGCGNGVSTANIDGKMLVGMDLSTNQMVRAKKRFRDIHYVVGDATKIPFMNNTFDLVVAINLLHHIADSGKVLREVYRVLKKGGKFLTVDPNLTNPIGFFGRGLFRLLSLRKWFPTFPQFALGDDERQFTKNDYYQLFAKSLFKKYKIIPHRIERLLFFATILLPPLVKFPGYEVLLTFVSRVGNRLVKVKPFDILCYFWLGEAVK